MKDYIQKKLEKYVVKYFKKHPEVKLVVITGSVGKTSTKRAVATLLSQRYRVRMHKGNHNTDLTAPMAFLGVRFPVKLRSVGQWLSVFRTARKRIKQPADVDVIVQELGTDHPGDIASFGRYLKPDLALVTAVTPEHMEFFGTIDAVAQEELSVAVYAKYTLINRDDIDGEFSKYLTNADFSTYGTSGLAEHRFEQQDFSIEAGHRGSIYAPEFPNPFPVTIDVVGEHSVRPIVGAIATAARMGLTPDEITKGLALIEPVPGRMNILDGLNDTIVIDDTYNSSPAAAEAAIQTLYTFDQAPQRIAILGDMRELGETSQVEHEKIGALCDPNLLAWVVTIGPDSEKHLAPIARQRGCQVKSFMNAIDAGAFVRSVAEPGAVILAKGSQDTIFAEEAVAVLVNTSEDIELVRQSEQWRQKKDEFFSKFQ